MVNLLIWRSQSLSLRERGLKCPIVRVDYRQGLVALLARAWIEIIVGRNEFQVACVALLARAWIEIPTQPRYTSSPLVALLARAWIEIHVYHPSFYAYVCRSPCESVD